MSPVVYTKNRRRMRSAEGTASPPCAPEVDGHQRAGCGVQQEVVQVAVARPRYVASGCHSRQAPCVPPPQRQEGLRAASKAKQRLPAASRMCGDSGRRLLQKRPHMLATSHHLACVLKPDPQHGVKCTCSLIHLLQDVTSDDYAHAHEPLPGTHASSIRCRASDSTGMAT